MNCTILIYSTTKAEEYAALVRSRLPEVRVLTSSTPEEAAAQIHEADVLFSWRFPGDLFARAERLRWVQSMGAGVEDLIAAPIPQSCLVTRIEGLFGDYMSEYAFAHMLAHTQQIRRLYAAQQEHKWAPFLVGKLAGKRLGVAGAGSIGAEVARKGKAFGMEVWALVRSERAIPEADRAFLPHQAAEFTAGVDYLVSSLPLTLETRGLIDPLQMKHGALLVNMGRGATIDEVALLEAVQAGRIQAVLDVFAKEPLPADHPFWRTPGITVTPHLSGPSVPDEVAQYFAANCRRYMAGKPLKGVVDRQRGY
ncbi:MAG TPA: D-2-hydroxyacid dehydrogenase [Symbiobacteriaceae bacterium]|nr:D-2-hydroxyacid dehydrogenase [Symbiobacteriaceae bacterium]